MIRLKIQRRRGMFEKFGTANLAGEVKRKKVCGPEFFKKLMGVL